MVVASVLEEDYEGFCWYDILEEDKIRPEAVLMTEPSNLEIKIGQRGRMEIKVETKGISCHGSAPERGENAIYKMAPVITGIEQLNERLPEKEVDIARRKRKAALSRAFESSLYGILVSTKDGQYHMDTALSVRERLREKGRRALLFAAEELSPQNLLPFKVDCWVNTACPRMAQDSYNRPVVNADELESFLRLF